MEPRHISSYMDDLYFRYMGSAVARVISDGLGPMIRNWLPTDWEAFFEREFSETEISYVFSPGDTNDYRTRLEILSTLVYHWVKAYSANKDPLYFDIE